MCCAAVSAAAECAGIWNGVAAIANRIQYAAGANYAADITHLLSIDFVLAATYQDSWDGTGSRPNEPGAYCDVQITLLLQPKEVSKALVTRNGLNGLTKCTYFGKVTNFVEGIGFKLE